MRKKPSRQYVLGWGSLHPSSRFFLPAPICYTTNMSEKHVFPGAQNTIIRGGTFMAADSVSEALVPLLAS